MAERITAQQVYEYVREKIVSKVLFPGNRIVEEELAEAKEQLENRRIQIENSGSIAEAALKLNGIFEAAQAAANQYLENLGVPTGAKEALEQPTALESQQMETGREEE